MKLNYKKTLAFTISGLISILFSTLFTIFSFITLSLVFAYILDPNGGGIGDGLFSKKSIIIYAEVNTPFLLFFTVFCFKKIHPFLVRNFNNNGLRPSKLKQNDFISKLMNQHLGYHIKLSYKKIFTFMISGLISILISTFITILSIITLFLVFAYILDPKGGGIGDGLLAAGMIISSIMIIFPFFLFFTVFFFNKTLSILKEDIQCQKLSQQ